MSGPIIRKYGFPNFEEIFGKREMEHGADDDEAPEQAVGPRVEGDGSTAPQESTKPARPAPKGKK